MFVTIAEVLLAPAPLQVDEVDGAVHEGVTKAPVGMSPGF